MSLTRLKNALGSKYHSWVLDQPSDADKTIVTLLKQFLPEIDPTSWKARLELGGAYLNGRRISTDQAISIPARLEYYEPKFDIDNLSAAFPAFNKNRIVFEDQYLLIYNKPSGLPTMPVREQNRFSLRQQLDHYVGTAVHLPSRLDTSASGLVIASKDPKFHHLTQRLYERRQIRKTYLIDVGSAPLWDWTYIQRNIDFDLQHPVLRQVVHTGGKSASTLFYKDLKRFQGCILVVEPKTGRTHQIRVHSASLGYPVKGDNFYGGPEAETLRLLSFSLAFLHPALNQEMLIELPENQRPDWLS